MVYTGTAFTLNIVRVGRIELPPDAWEAPVLPLNYTRLHLLCLYMVY